MADFTDGETSGYPPFVGSIPMVVLFANTIPKDKKVDISSSLHVLGPRRWNPDQMGFTDLWTCSTLEYGWVLILTWSNVLDEGPGPPDHGETSETSISSRG